MKRTFTANIDGQVFNIDEDAYAMLRTYLEQLRKAFGADEGPEIVADIESRIRELFNEKTANGATVIVIADVDRAIKTVGTAEEISGSSDDEATLPPPYKENAAAQNPGIHPEPPVITINLPKGKKYFRSMTNKVFGGVVGGLGTYLGWNANIMRLLLILLFLGLGNFDLGWTLCIAYLVAWMVLPVANSPITRLEAEGKAATIQSVGEYTAQLYRPDKEEPGFWSSFFSALGKIIIAFFGFCAAIVAIVFLCIFLGIVAVVIGAVAHVPEFVSPFDDLSTLGLWAVGLWMLFGILICTAMTWGGATTLFKFNPTSRTIKVTAVLIGMILLVSAIVVTILATAA